MSSSCSGALSLASSCLAGVWGSHEAIEEHLAAVWLLGARCGPRHGSALCALCRMPSEPRALPRTLQPQVLHAGRPHWIMGHAKRAAGPHWAGRAPRRLAWAPGRFRLGGPRIQEIPFPLFELVWIVSKFGNSYLSAQSSKNYEISSVGFIIL
jgi:hypothetical protein